MGDIESQPFLEAIRQVAAEKGRGNVLFIHVPLIVSIPGSGELKSKPTQHSVKELLSLGIQPDILVCRTDSPLPDDVRHKIALFCNVEPECVIPNVTASTLYEVPLLLEDAGLCREVCRKLGFDCGEPDMKAVDGARREDQARAQAGDHRARRQVYRSARRLSERR